VVTAVYMARSVQNSDYLSVKLEPIF
jgi:hypothetical protein